MKFTMAPMKHNRSTVGRIEGHNTRLHTTASQLPKVAWFTGKGRHKIIAWDGAVLTRAKSLAKRKDAVLAIELILQVGKQSDWREIPTAEHPHGKPKPGCVEPLKKFAAAAVKAGKAIFGADNIISLELHTDESSPHLHLVVAPIHEGRLQAKHWLDGPKMVAQLREKLHAIINETVPCTYEKGGTGGLPHDPGKAAGALPVPSAGLFKKLKGAVSNVIELEEAKKRIKELDDRNAELFSELKRALEISQDRYDAMGVADTNAGIANERARLAEKRAAEAEGKLLALLTDPDDTEPETPAQKVKPSTAPRFGPR